MLLSPQLKLFLFSSSTSRPLRCLKTGRWLPRCIWRKSVHIVWLGRAGRGALSFCCSLLMLSKQQTCTYLFKRTHANFLKLSFHPSTSTLTRFCIRILCRVCKQGAGKAKGACNANEVQCDNWMIIFDPTFCC